MAKFATYICVYFSDPEQGDTYAKFVTGLESHNIARWEAGKPAKKFSESFARDIVFGLTLNGYAAAVIQVIDGVQLKN